KASASSASRQEWIWSIPGRDALVGRGPTGGCTGVSWPGFDVSFAGDPGGLHLPGGMARNSSQLALALLGLTALAGEPSGRAAAGAARSARSLPFIRDRFSSAPSWTAGWRKGDAHHYRAASGE